MKYILTKVYLTTYWDSFCRAMGQRPLSPSIYYSCFQCSVESRFQKIGCLACTWPMGWWRSLWHSLHSEVQYLFIALDDVQEPHHSCWCCPIRVSTSFGDCRGFPDDDIASSLNHVIGLAKQAKKSKWCFHRNVKRAVICSNITWSNFCEHQCTMWQEGANFVRSRGRARAAYCEIRKYFLRSRVLYVW